MLEEFKKAHEQITTDPRTIPVWQPVIAKYSPAFLGECDKAIQWSNELVTTWLSRNMLKDHENKEHIISDIIKELGDHSVSYAHNRHLSNQKCKDIGLVIHDLEDDQELQDKVLSIHHIYFHTLSSTSAFKIIENQDGKAFVLQAQQMLVAPSRTEQNNEVPLNISPESPVSNDEDGQA